MTTALSSPDLAEVYSPQRKAAPPKSGSASKQEAARKVARQIAHWMLLALACAFMALIARVGEVTHDAFHEMALFRELLFSGAFAVLDSFAYTPTVNPLVHHEWGTGALLYLVSVSTGWGLGGLTILKVALVGSLWGMLYRVARMRGVHPYVFALLSLTVFPTLWVGFATIRATLFTLLFVSIQLWMHERDRRGYRWWLLGWWCMLVLWLNLHAGFVVGIGLLGLHAVERFTSQWSRSRSLAAACKSTWHLTLAGPLVLLALPINPYGWQYVPYLVKAISMPRPRIAEWLPLWHTHEPLFTLCMFALSLAWIGLAVRRQKTSNLIGLLGLSVCAFLALKHLRHGAIYSVVWIAYVPAWLTHTSFGRDVVRRLQSHPSLSLGVSQSLVAALLLWSSAYGFGKTTLTGDAAQSIACYPIDAVRFLAEQKFRGNLLTPFHAGAYVSWQLSPEVKVSLDGRYEVAYAPPVFEEHWEFFEAGPEWWRLLDKYPHDAVLVNQSAKVRPLLEIFRASALSNALLPTQDSWRFVYEDDAYVILARPTVLVGSSFRGQSLGTHGLRGSGPAAPSAEADLH